MKPGRLIAGITHIAIAILIVMAWIIYDDWSTPRSTGLEIKDGAVFSVIPFGLALFLSVRGLLIIIRAILHK